MATNKQEQPPQQSNQPSPPDLSSVASIVPPQPRNLHRSLVTLYTSLVAIFSLLSLFSFGLEFYYREAIPSQHFLDQNGTVLSLNDFRLDIHGQAMYGRERYPRCHPLYEPLDTKEASPATEDSEAKAASDSKEEEPDVLQKVSKVLEEMKNKVLTLFDDFDWNEAQQKLKLKNLFPSLHLLMISTIILLVSCKHSAWLYLKPSKKGTDDEGSDEEEEASAQQAIQKDDAYLFPIFGSITLFSLFLLYKYLSAEYIQVFLTVYILVLSMNSVSANYNHIVALMYKKKYITHTGFSKKRSDCKPLFTLAINREFPLIGKVEYEWAMTRFDITSLFMGLAIAVVYELSKKYLDAEVVFATSGPASEEPPLMNQSNVVGILNNFLGLSFCLLALKMITLNDYSTGAVLLIGLFFYDIFWVFFSQNIFGSNVMVTVATKVNAPIKLLFYGGIDICRLNKFNMLGLGDIVVPGIFLNFLAKFDCYRDYCRATAAGKGEKEVDYTCDFQYFNITMVSYVLSLVTTISVMFFFNHAQPALLYIVPFVVLTSLGVAVVKGELKLLLGFSIEDASQAEQAKEVLAEKKNN